MQKRKDGLADWDDVRNCESFSDIHIQRFKSPAVVVDNGHGVRHFSCVKTALWDNRDKPILDLFAEGHLENLSTNIMRRETSQQKTKKSQTKKERPDGQGDFWRKAVCHMDRHHVPPRNPNYCFLRIFRGLTEMTSGRGDNGLCQFFLSPTRSPPTVRILRA